MIRMKFRGNLQSIFVNAHGGSTGVFVTMFRQFGPPRTYRHISLASVRRAQRAQLALVSNKKSIRVDPQPEFFVDGANDGWWLYKGKIYTGVNMANVLMDEYADDPRCDGVRPEAIDTVWYWISE